MDTYKLEGTKYVPLKKGELYFADEVTKIVAKSTVDIDGESIDISTVFLTFDHGFGNTVDPILFETMVFGGEFDGYQERYRFWKDAELGHKKAVEMVLKGKFV